MAAQAKKIATRLGLLLLYLKIVVVSLTILSKVQTICNKTPFQTFTEVKQSW
jgi:hypothetical protein